MVGLLFLVQNRHLSLPLLFASGGYVLKYMYKVTTSDFAKFGTTDFIPVATDSTVSETATDGKIESLSVTAGSGYTDGTYYEYLFTEMEQVLEQVLVQS